MTPFRRRQNKVKGKPKPTGRGEEKKTGLKRLLTEKTQPKGGGKSLNIPLNERRGKREKSLRLCH